MAKKKRQERVENKSQKVERDGETVHAEYSKHVKRNDSIHIKKR
jgi:hypothetical protein